MSQERFLELKAKIQSLGAGGFMKLPKEEQSEYQALKAEFSGDKIELPSVQTETPVTSPIPEPAKESDSVSVPKDLLASLVAQIEELKVNQQNFLGRTPQEVLPGQPVAVTNARKEYKKIFKRFRDTAELPWEYIADIKWLKFYFDREIEEKVNLFKITTVSSNGDIKVREMKDVDLSRIGEAVLLKITDRESKEFEVQDRLTPLITTAVRYTDSANPKSVTGIDVQSVGPVKNMIHYLETRFTVHVPADVDSEGREVIDTVNAPAKVTFQIVDNMGGNAGVHLDASSIKIL